MSVSLEGNRKKIMRISEKSLDVNGMSIAYTAIGDDDARPVFCVHGLLSNGRDYDFLGTALAQNNYRVISIDLPGRGKSDWFEDPSLYQPANYIPYCLAVIQKEIGDKPFDWFGVSLGGMIGMALTGMEELKMERLIIGDIGAEIPAEGLNLVAKLSKFTPCFENKDDAAFFLKTRCSQWGISQEQTWDHLITHNIVPTKEGQYCMHYDPAIGEALKDENEALSVWELWRAVKQRVLLIRGGRSFLLPTEIANKMRAEYTGEKFSELVFDDCGHVPNMMEEEQIDSIIQSLN